MNMAGLSPWDPRAHTGHQQRPCDATKEAQHLARGRGLVGFSQAVGSWANRVHKVHLVSDGLSVHKEGSTF